MLNNASTGCSTASGPSGQLSNDIWPCQVSLILSLEFPMAQCLAHYCSVLWCCMSSGYITHKYDTSLYAEDTQLCLLQSFINPNMSFINLFPCTDLANKTDQSGGNKETWAITGASTECLSTCAGWPAVARTVEELDVRGTVWFIWETTSSAIWTRSSSCWSPISGMEQSSTFKKENTWCI